MAYRDYYPYDPDIIARLYAADLGPGGVNSIDVFKQNPTISIPALLERPPKLPPPSPTSLSLPSQGPEPLLLPPYIYGPHIPLRFNRGPKANNGFILGWDKNSDVVLPHTPGIGYHHCAFMFDKNNRLIFRDLDSVAGTEVTYDGEGEGRRRAFDWVVGGHEFAQNTRSIIITIYSTLRFQIVVPCHDITSPSYLENVALFCAGKSNTESFLGDLTLQSRGCTVPATQGLTPGTGPIYRRSVAGRGAYGIVYRLWNVSTGEVIALKEPTPEAIRDNMVDIFGWEDEAKVMSSISHDNIIRFVGFLCDPWPKLYLEWAPHKSLAHLTMAIQPVESLQILCQSLSALAYLHGHEEPLVHRDIKPANILVHSRDSHMIRIKLADFGLTKSGNCLTTLCGTDFYIAPEIHIERGRRYAGCLEPGSYTPAVDIWSLGVVIFQLIHQFPGNDRGRYLNIHWCHDIARWLENDIRTKPCQLNQFLARMVVLDPNARSSAQSCYHQALLLFGRALDRCQAPTPVPHAKERGKSWGGEEDCGNEDDLKTIMPQRTYKNISHLPSPLLPKSIGLVENTSSVGSEVPSPTFDLSSRKRSRPSTPPSSVVRRCRVKSTHSSTSREKHGDDPETSTLKGFVPRLVLQGPPGDQQHGTDSDRPWLDLPSKPKEPIALNSSAIPQQYNQLPVAGRAEPRQDEDGTKEHGHEKATRFKILIRGATL